MAHDTFSSAYQCTSSDVKPRNDMGQEIFEVVGCGHDVIYQCDGGLADAAGNMTVPPSCRATDWCTQPGCTKDDPKSASAKFAIDNSCPVERVAATRTQNPEQPSAEIAADPARLAMWQQQERERTRHMSFIAVQGCNTAATYVCVEQAGPAPGCAAWSPNVDASAAGSASAGSATPQ
jgi:hypothetical protein